MSAIVNDRDVLLQAAQVRNTNPTAGKLIMISADSTAFKVTAGVAAPVAIAMQCQLVGVAGVPTFSVVGANRLIGDGLNRTLSFADVTSDTVVVTATLVYAGITYTAKQSFFRLQMVHRAHQEHRVHQVLRVIRVIRVRPVRPVLLVLLVFLVLLALRVPQVRLVHPVRKVFLVPLDHPATPVHLVPQELPVRRVSRIRLCMHISGLCLARNDKWCSDLYLGNSELRQCSCDRMERN